MSPLPKLAAIGKIPGHGTFPMEFEERRSRIDADETTLQRRAVDRRENDDLTREVLGDEPPARRRRVEDALGRLGNFSLGDERGQPVASTTHVRPSRAPVVYGPSAAPHVADPTDERDLYLAAVPTAAPKRRGRPPGTGSRQRHARRAREADEEQEDEDDENPARRRRVDERAETTAASPEAWQRTI